MQKNKNSISPEKLTSTTNTLQQQESLSEFEVLDAKNISQQQQQESLSEFEVLDAENISQQQESLINFEILSAKNISQQQQQQQQQESLSEFKDLDAENISQQQESLINFKILATENISKLQKNTSSFLENNTATTCPRLEADILLTQVLSCNRSYLYAHSDKTLSENQIKKLDNLLARLAKHEPLAYITSRKSFWKEGFIVSEDTLIPRAETESLLQWIGENFSSKQGLKVLDLGTGCGAIACSLAADYPSWNITATDISQKALTIARQNAQQMQLDINFYQGSWFEALPANNKFDIIISNPPYIDSAEEVYLGAVHEPETALYAAENGMADLQHIISNAKHWLKPGGCLLVEHGATQQQKVKVEMSKNNFSDVYSGADHHLRPRFVAGFLKTPQVVSNY